MSKVRKFVVRQLQLGMLQDIVTVLLAIGLLYGFSVLCIVIVRDSIARGDSLLFSSNYPIILVIGGFFLSYYASSELFKLNLTMQTDVKSWIRFDVALKVLGFSSCEELYNFAKAKKIKLYISDSTIIESANIEIRGRVYSLMSSLIHSYGDISRYVDDRRAFFDKDEFDSAVNDLLTYFQVAERPEQTVEHQTLREAISSLISEKADLNAMLGEISGDLSAAKARAGKAELAKRKEQAFTKVAVRVAARLGRVCAKGGKVTRAQIQQEIDNVLAYEKDLHDLYNEYGDASKRFAERVRDGLPPEIVKGAGKPKNSPL